MKDDKKIERAAIIAAAVFGAATLAVLVMQITPRTGVLPAAGYGEGRTPAGPNTTPDVKDARRPVQESGQPANSQR
jgi:hypothetical protein